MVHSCNVESDELEISDLNRLRLEIFLRVIDNRIELAVISEHIVIYVRLEKSDGGKI